MSDQSWPAASHAAIRRFGHPHARLFPLLRCRVMTPRGPGRLVQAFASRASVVLEGEPGRLAFFEPGEVGPAPDGGGLGL